MAKLSSPQAQKMQLQVRSCCLPSFPQVIFLICAYITVYMIYVKFRRTFDSENDSFRLEFLLVPVTGLSFLENHSFTPLEVTKTWGRKGEGKQQTDTRQQSEQHVEKLRFLTAKAGRKGKVGKP